jgi:hypothetical protein
MAVLHRIASIAVAIASGDGAEACGRDANGL